MCTRGLIQVLSRRQDILIIRHKSVFTNIRKLLKSSEASSSLESLRNPPPTGRFAVKRILIRELLQDGSIVLPKERDQFEQLALWMDKKLTTQYQLIQNELSDQTSSHTDSLETIHHYTPISQLLSQPIEPTLSLSSPQSRPLEHGHGVSTSYPSQTASERQEHEFWLLRRLSQLAPQAGFIEVTRDSLEQACRERRRTSRDLAVTFVNPDDYHVIRFWIRGVHPFMVTGSKGDVSSTGQLDAANASSTGALSLTSRLTSRVILTAKQMKDLVVGGVKRRVSRYFRVDTGYQRDLIHSPDEPCLSTVLMAVQRKGEDRLQLKLFEHVPVPLRSGPSSYTDNLCYLLPELRYRPLTMGGRAVLLASTATAIGCLGLVAPAAWLLTSNPDLVIAWSVAATTGAAATSSLVWARYWRAKAKLANWLQQLHYECGRTWGSHAVDSMLKLAREEEFKAALIAYALLLRPTEAGQPLTSTQLAVRAESWIAKRLSPTGHISSTLSNVLHSRFTGGSGPLFDLTFDPDRPLRLLRQLDLVRGSDTTPRAVPLATAAIALQADSTRGSSGELGPLWILDPLIDADAGASSMSGETR